MGKFQLALKDFNTAISLSQDSAEAWYAKADLEYSLGQLKESVDSYIHAVKIQPQNYDVWYTLAETYIELGDWLNALDAFDKCLVVKPADANAVYGSLPDGRWKDQGGVPVRAGHGLADAGAHCRAVSDLRSEHKHAPEARLRGAGVERRGNY